MGTDESPLQSAELAIRNAIAAPDGDIVQHLLDYHEISSLDDQRALVVALAGRLKVAELRKGLQLSHRGM